jgi:hypothetical protein
MLARMLMAVVATLAVAACGGGDGESFDGPLTYVRGGGLTGEARTLTVRPDGTGTFVVERGLVLPRRAAIRLEAGERDRLARLLSEVDLGPIEDDESEPMPDAYGYSIGYRGEEVSWQTDHRPEHLDALTGELSRLAEKYGPPEP